MKHLARVLFVCLVLSRGDRACAEKTKLSNADTMPSANELEEDNTHYHHHYMRNTTLFSIPTNTSSADTYRPKTGEILVKDSLVYSQKPESRQLRRQLWPIMEETMQTIAHGMATGAKILKHMVRPNLLVTGDPKYYMRNGKAVTIKNVYLGHPSPLLHKRQTKPFKLPSPTIIVGDKRPVRTVSDDYVLRFKGEDPLAYKVRTKSSKSNPFANMGVTGYKNFEKTVLRELEEKEERKVEASMFLPDKSVEEQLLDGTPFADWKPMVSMSTSVSPPTTEKPHIVTGLHTKTNGLEVKPVHETIDESPLLKRRPNQIEAAPFKVRNSKYTLRKPSRPTVVATVAPTPPTSAPSTTAKAFLEVPNYPDFYIKQNKHLVTKPTTLSKLSLDDEGFRTSQNFASPSNHRPVFAEPQGKESPSVTVSSARPRRVHRHRAREPTAQSDTPDDDQTTKKASTSTMGRGNVKFGSRYETE